ncbi:dehydrogenase, PQQ-dependent, s-GDH family [Loktanella salsilacus]|jgi:PQQ-dependent dehydrogenase (s-GDH family)|uniref:Dehydrogenase, PQQ-dependent, s-GDH family n=1 Tax=Loktanella salsilacus TaxID=195913 RepID=A0A1I4JTE3_9RHOB|nr:glucose/sorbosone family PQQ-dependent dehydrogenase [Loktanella salsilacus]SFL69829.1 dehydrogenase, PQQ-dependent, s-GDH family [Loktanella salsilacus]
MKMKHLSYLSGGLAVTLSIGASIAMAQVTPTPIESGDNSLFSSRVLTTGLDNPWAMRWGPDDQIWVTERTSGEITRVDPVTGSQQVLLTLDDVYTGPQHEGLLGLALHPGLLQNTGNDFIYIGYTVNDGSEAEPDPSAQIVRYRYDADTQQLVDKTVLISGMPAGNDHNAGRVVFGPDDKLYYSIGEQGHNFGRNLRKPNLALVLPTADEVGREDWRTYSGKILRLNLDGTIPDDNPEIESVRSHIYSYGHRNPQGLAFGENGTLYEAEHGPATDDELNIIQAGGNYGWPRVAGRIDDRNYLYINWSEAAEDVSENTDPLPESVPQLPESTFDGDMVEPLATYFTVDDDYPIGQICGYICDPTIAPSSILPYSAGEDGIAEWDNSVLLTTLKHGTLYVQSLSDDGTAAEGDPVAWLSTQNRYRDVLVAPENRVFIATDAFGSAAQKFGDGLNTSILHNPGAILLYTYGEEGGSDLGMTRSSQTVEEARADGIASDNPKEFEDPNTGKETAPDDVAAVMPDSEVMEVVARGGPQFAQTCSTCHGPAGRSDAAAVLAENEKLTDAGYVASTVVHGFGYMPAFGSQLSDTEIAEIGTYIRNSWGNDYGVLTTDDVAQAR